ncbi:MAG: hypothetical protein MUE41_14065 [Gemmatimonadaceae bacterium]|nr:hypothetical protein [Gemmatimonadaceae bacterium]
MTPGLVVFGVVAVLAVTTSGGRSRLAGLATAAWMVVVVIALFLFTKSVPPRVLDPIWLLGAIVIAATVPQAVRGTMPRAAVFVATLLVLIGFNGWGAWGHARSVARVQRELRTVPALAKQRVAVAISHAYGEMWHPFWGNADLHARAWFPISWPNLMPPAHEAARRMGVDRLLLELPCRDDIVLVASVSYAAAIQRFAHEHGTRGCRFVQVHQSRDLMAFVGSAPPGAGGAAAPVTHGSALQPKTD